MRTLQRVATVCFIGGSLAALISACGSSDAAPPPSAGAGAPNAGAPNAGAPSAGAPGAGAPGQLTGDAVKGKSLYTSASCASCHGDNAQGSLGPNITGDPTAGIGAWTQAEFHNAVRAGMNRKGTAMCTLMPKFDASYPVAVSDQDTADLYAFLKTTANSTVTAGVYCMPGGGLCTPSCTGNQ